MNDAPEAEVVEVVESPQIEHINIEPKRRFSFSKVTALLKRRKWIFAILLVLLLIVGYFGFAAYKVSKEAKEFAAAATVLKDKAGASDLAAMREALPNFKKEFNDFKSSYALLRPFKFFPFVGAYISDGDHFLAAGTYGIEAGEVLLDAAGPYSDILGLSTSAEDKGKDGEKTAQERLDFIVSSIPDLIPKIDILKEKLGKVKAELVQVDINKYPKSLFGKPVQEPLRTGVDAVVAADDFVTRGKPLLEVSPYLLGNTEKRTYLVLFQNDKELRATGGFLTAYSIAEVEKGKFNPVNSSDIYSLDAKYKPSVPAPKALIDYIKGPYQLSKNFRLRDMNWSPDFRESTELFLKESEKVGIKDIDGLIAVDTHLLVNLLNVLGPIGVPGFGNFSNNVEPKCNCPQVIFELESFADVEGPIVWDPLDPTKIIYAPANIDNRKKIIGPLMNSILANALAQPKEKLPELFNALFKSLTEKNVLLYMHDDKAQAAAESFGVAGRVTQDFDGDYLHINDSNLGGRKSNLYVTQEVHQSVEVAKDGSVTNTLEITYKNPQTYDGWLNSVLPNWSRIYVPKGSEIVDVIGFEDKGETYEELGKTVISGGFKLRPQGISKITITYKPPIKVQKDYKVLFQKQAGTDAPLYSVEVNGKSEEFYLRTDKEMSFKVK